MIRLYVHDLPRQVRIIAMPVVIALSSVAVPAAAAESIDRSVIGQWRLTAALDAADITSLDEIEASRLVGKTLVIGSHQLMLDRRECPSPDFASENVEPRLYLREHYRADASRLGLPNPVKVVHLDCTSAFIKSRDRLVVFWKGWFFDAVRVGR